MYKSGGRQVFLRGMRRWNTLYPTLSGIYNRYRVFHLAPGNRERDVGMAAMGIQPVLTSWQFQVVLTSDRERMLLR